MCSTCGCNQPDDEIKMTVAGEEAKSHNHHKHHHHDKDKHHGHHHHDEHDHEHQHSHDHHHQENDLEHAHHSHGHDHQHKVIKIEQDILYKNQMLGERNRGFFEAKDIMAINIISSPGSGKTTLLEKTLIKLKDKLPFYVVEGDQQTMRDADRINATGVPVIQINTGNGCHLDAEMIRNAVKKLNVKEKSVLIIENVGNLVCPSLFDLGEKHRIVLMSVTEGDDKPIKYPTAFMHAGICIFSKTDLLPHVDFDIEQAKTYARQVNPDIKFFELSAKSGDGMNEWCDWLTGMVL